MKPATRLSCEIILAVNVIVIVMNLPRLYASAFNGDSGLIRDSVIALVLALLATPLIFGVFLIAAQILRARDRFIVARRSRGFPDAKDPRGS